MKKNKRGQITFMLIFFVIASLITMIVLGLSSWTFGIVDEQLRSMDFELGNISWNETYNETLGLGLGAASTTSPQLISIGLLFGMILTMMFVGYYAGAKDKMWILLDIGILIVVEILAGISVSSFYSIMNMTPELLDVYSNTLSAGSKFVINLPIIAPIVGVIIMIMTNIVNKIRRKEEVVRF
jgi:hypothetical protein